MARDLRAKDGKASHTPFRAAKTHVSCGPKKRKKEDFECVSDPHEPKYADTHGNTDKYTQKKNAKNGAIN